MPSSSSAEIHSFLAEEPVTIRWTVATNPERAQLRLYRITLDPRGNQLATTLLTEAIARQGISSSEFRDAGHTGITWAYQLRYVTEDGHEQVLYTATCTERQASGSSAIQSSAHLDRGLLVLDGAVNVALTATLPHEAESAQRGWRPRPPVPPPRGAQDVDVAYV